MSKTLSDTEQARRRQLVTATRAAIGQGQSIEQYQATHQRAIAGIIAAIRTRMTECGVIDPVEILPEILISLQEAAIAEARIAAKAAARDEMKTLLRKVLAP
jgi:hypothetical protein